MIKTKGYGYYNYFLILPLVLIVGYFFVSMFFLNRSFKSGKQAEELGMTVEKTNAVIQQVTQLETSAYSNIISKSKESASLYLHKKLRLLKYVEGLRAHCQEYDFAGSENEKLDSLISQRIKTLDAMMVNDSMSNLYTRQQMTFGNNITMEILKTLKKIRAQNSENRELNHRDAEIANRNAMVLMGAFGAIMLLIVFISFFKMRKEILRNARYLSEINQINIELSASNESLENFAYVASHDLNEPLRKIITFGDLVENELESAEVDRKTIIKYVNRMQSSSTRMQELIDDLLTYSRLTKQVKIVNRIDLNSVLNIVISDLEISIRETDAIIESSKLPDNIKADEVQMRQLFQNLISNSIKFHKSSSAPKIHIECEKVSCDEIEIDELQMNQSPNYWKITFADNGIGFDEKYKDKIFAVFQRLHGRSAYKGTGIGLSICKKIVENHNGSISAFSKEGEGATFIIYLPV